MGSCLSSSQPSNPNEPIDTSKKPTLRFQTSDSQQPQIQELEQSPSMRRMNEENEENDQRLKIVVNPDLKYQIGQIISQGPHGTVYEALSMKNGEQVAIKTVKSKKEHIENIMNYLTKKLLNIDHLNLVNYIEVDETPNYEVSIVSELISGSSLHTVLSTFGKLNENICKLFTKQILCGLEHLQKQGSYHGNLKPQNIFVDKNGIVKMGDYFIISRKMLVEETTKTPIRKPICYIAPEYLLYETKSSKSDIWSLGCILLEILTNELPWRQYNYNLKHIKNSLKENKIPDIPRSISDSARNFLSHCLVVDPKVRSSAEELLLHPYLSIDETKMDIKKNKSNRFQRMITMSKDANSIIMDKSKTASQLILYKKMMGIVNKPSQSSQPNSLTPTKGGGGPPDFEEKKEEGVGERKFERMTTIEIRKKNESERKRFEEVLLRTLNE